MSLITGEDKPFVSPLLCRAQITLSYNYIFTSCLSLTNLSALEGRACLGPILCIRGRDRGHISSQTTAWIELKILSSVWALTLGGPGVKLSSKTWTLGKSLHLSEPQFPCMLSGCEWGFKHNDECEKACKGLWAVAIVWGLLAFRELALLREEGMYRNG